jgi:hypothetical protein
MGQYSVRDSAGPEPDAPVLKLRFFCHAIAGFPGKNAWSPPSWREKPSLKRVNLSFSPGKTAEKKRNFKTGASGSISRIAHGHIAG